MDQQLIQQREQLLAYRKQLDEQQKIQENIAIEKHNQLVSRMGEKQITSEIKRAKELESKTREAFEKSLQSKKQEQPQNNIQSAIYTPGAQRADHATEQINSARRSYDNASKLAKKMSGKCQEAKRAWETGEDPVAKECAKNQQRIRNAFEKMLRRMAASMPNELRSELQTAQQEMEQIPAMQQQAEQKTIQSNGAALTQMNDIMEDTIERSRTEGLQAFEDMQDRMETVMHADMNHNIKLQEQNMEYTEKVARDCASLEDKMQKQQEQERGHHIFGRNNRQDRQMDLAEQVKDQTKPKENIIEKVTERVKNKNKEQEKPEKLSPEKRPEDRMQEMGEKMDKAIGNSRPGWMLKVVEIAQEAQKEGISDMYDAQGKMYQAKLEKTIVPPGRTIGDKYQSLDQRLDNIQQVGDLSHKDMEDPAKTMQNSKKDRGGDAMEL